MKLQVGQKVRFGRLNGEQTLGEIVKVNSKKYKVKILEDRGLHRISRKGSIWTVPFSLVTLVDATQTPKESESSFRFLCDHAVGFKRGDRVVFGRRNGEKTLGEVVKVNPKTLKVKILEDRGSRSKAGEVWSVTPDICKLVKVNLTA